MIEDCVVLGDLCWKCACERGQGCKKLVMIKGNREIGARSKLHDCRWCCVCAKDTMGLAADRYANRYGIFTCKPTWGLPLRLRARYAFVLERMWPVDVEALADFFAGVDGRVGPCQGFGMVVCPSRAHLRINRF